MAAEEMAKNKANNYHSVNKPHRLLLQIGRTSKLYMHLTLEESSARAFRKARGQVLKIETME